MMKMASLGKSKKLQPSESMDQASRLERVSSGQNFISRQLTSFKSRRTKSGVSVIPQVVIIDSEHAELEAAFKVFDANGDGQICLTELGAVLRSLGGDVSHDELRLIMEEADKNRDGFICLEEFKAVNICRRGEDPIREAFATFDKDGNNLISADELRTVLQSLGEKSHSLEDCRRMISQVDKNGDGFVDYKEFESLLSAKS